MGIGLVTPLGQLSIGNGLTFAGPRTYTSSSESLGAVIGQIRANTVKAVAVAANKRSALLPAVPTIAAAVPRAAWVQAVRNIKRAVRIPVMASNRITTPEVAEAI